MRCWLGGECQHRQGQQPVLSSFPAMLLLESSTLAQETVHYGALLLVIMCACMLCCFCLVCCCCCAVLPDSSPPLLSVVPAAKLVLISSNCPPLRKSELEYYAMLAKGTSIHHYSGGNTELGTGACVLRLFHAPSTLTCSFGLWSFPPSLPV